MRPSAFILIGALASPASAIELHMPLDCVIGVDCFIQSYVDSEPGPEARDHTCGALSYEGHEGTDFRVFSGADVLRGVDVLAPADGTVRAAVDGQPENNFRDDGLNPNDCGNALVIDHADGWQTQMCHLKGGTFVVGPGDSVKAGDTVAQLGSSGGTSFPHLHFAVRRFGALIDPFTGVSPTGCEAPRAEPLWADEDIRYAPTAILALGVAGEKPTLERVEQDDLGIPSPSDQEGSVFVWTKILGAQPGDSIRLRVYDKARTKVADETFEPADPLTLFLPIIELTPDDLPTDTWPEEEFTARLTYERGERVLADDGLSFEVAD